MERLADRFTRWLVAQGSIPEEDMEIYRFGFLCLLGDASQLAVLALLSLVFHCGGRMLVSVCVFAATKRAVGGWHLASQWGCLVVSSLTLLGIALAAGRIAAVPAPRVSAACLAVAAGLTVCRAPVAHPHNPKTVQAMAGLRRRALRVVLSWCALLLPCTVLFPPSHKALPLSGSLALVAATFTLLIPVERRKPA